MVLRPTKGKCTMKKLLLVTAITLFSAGAIAHSGGTDSAGCHTNHKTGAYHCH
ncbi:YHYH domain-containing protein [Marinobacter salsuginis]|uniref:YHYH domain-containing protein n=1 Tax=Marinobacter salsuginis TaxID=418719 RepID=UPI0035195038